MLFSTLMLFVQFEPTTYLYCDSLIGNSAGPSLFLIPFHLGKLISENNVKNFQAVAHLRVLIVIFLEAKPL